MTRQRLTQFIGFMLLLAASVSYGHEVRPAFLQLEEVNTHTFDVMWKQPMMQNRRLPLEPQFPDACERISERPPENTGDALLERWQVHCNLRVGELSVGGLTGTLTDVLVRITFADGESVQHILRPDAPKMNLNDHTQPLASYLRLGVEHLLFGVDHILFVVGLFLLISGAWRMVKAITAFTVAHSITLVLSVFGLVHVPQAPVEACIALSIVFLARELMLPTTQRSVLTTSKPWLMAFAFGLLHGFGFAGALADIGLPLDQLALSLFLFNLGIELGQLLIVALMLAASWLLSKFWEKESQELTALQWSLVLAMGSLAAYWSLDRMLQIIV